MEVKVEKLSNELWMATVIDDDVELKALVAPSETEARKLGQDWAERFELGFERA